MTSTGADGDDKEHWVLKCLPWVGILAAVAAAWCSQNVKYDDATQSTNWWYLAPMLAMTAVAPLAPAIRAHFAAKRAREAKTAEHEAVDREAQARIESRTDLNAAIDPVVRQVGLLCAARTRPQITSLAESIKPLVVTTAQQVVKPREPGEGSRSCFFAYTVTDGKRALVPTTLHAGRLGTPRTTFKEGTPEGDAALAMVLRNGERLCEDVDDKPPPGWNGRERDYKTFASVAVVNGETVYGMLTADAPTPGDIRGDDLAVLRVLADLLACAFARAG